MRLFIAIELPKEVKEYLQTIKEKLKTDANIRWVPIDQMHLTLKFLGSVEENTFSTIKKDLGNITVTPFSFKLKGMGVFPSKNYIRVLWAGVEPEEQVVELQKQIDEKLEKNFKKEKQFKTHITLGRVKYTDDPQELYKQLKKIKIESLEVNVDHFSLFESKMQRTGAIHTVLEKYS